MRNFSPNPAADVKGATFRGAGIPHLVDAQESFVAKYR
jgi:hypothetical protein